MFLNKNLIAIVILILFSTISYINLNFFIQNEKENGYIINISGMQRMLSQKIALDSYHLMQFKLKKYEKELNNSIEQLYENSVKIDNFNREKGIDNLFENKNNLNKQLNLYLKEAKKFLNEQNSNSYKYIYDNSINILNNLNKNVAIYEAYNVNQISKIHKIAFATFTCSVILILFIYYFILKPTTSKLQDSKLNLEKQNRKLKKYIKKVEELSITDGLTGLYNRRYFNDIFKKEIARSKRDEKYLSFLILDIDHFKQYNDTYGHQKGDDVLISVAKTLKDSINRGSDFIFRLGGEEFGIIFSNLNEEESLKFSNRVKENIEKLQIEHSKNSASDFITSSFGLVVQKGETIASENEIYKLADDSLYEAKKSGRNRVILKKG